MGKYSKRNNKMIKIHKKIFKNTVLTNLQFFSERKCFFWEKIGQKIITINQENTLK